jgi:hypothetical protein
MDQIPPRQARAEAPGARRVVPVCALLSPIERVPFVHFIGEIGIGVAAHWIHLHCFRRANCGHFFRRNDRAISVGRIERTSFRAAQPEKRERRIIA